MNELNELIESLKSYQKQGLDIKKAMVKLFEDEGIILSEVIELLGEKKEIALSKLIEKLEKKNPLKKLMDAIDSFANEGKNHPVQSL